MSNEEQELVLELATHVHEAVRQLCEMQIELSDVSSRLYRLERRLDGTLEANHLWDGS